MSIPRHDWTRRRLLAALSSGIYLSLFSRPVMARTAALQRVADGIYVREGLDEDASAGNHDAIANLSLIVGENSAAVIDPGGSLDDGMAFKTAIARVTNLPLRYVVFTHAHPDHVFGAQAFAQDGVEYVAHASFPETLANRGNYYQRNLNQLLGHAAGNLIVPQLLVKERLELDLGNRPLTLRAHPPAHSSCDLSAWDARTQTLLAGDLLFVRRVPSLDGSLKGWLSALADLKGWNAKRAVPGHGPAAVNWPNAAADLERYLLVLQSDTRRAVAQGVEIDAAARTVGQSERRRWTLFDAYHGHNVTRAYKEIEWE